MRKTFLKLLRMVLVTSALAATAVVPTAALAEQHLTVQSQVSHFFECLGLLFSDPAKHAELCGPASTEQIDPWSKDKCSSYTVPAAYQRTAYPGNSCCETLTAAPQDQVPMLLLVSPLCCPQAFLGPLSNDPMLLMVGCGAPPEVSFTFRDFELQLLAV